MKLLLDTNVLARVCHTESHRDVQEWFRTMLTKGEGAPELLVSVLADYELRRTLLLHKATESLRQLDRIAGAVRYLPVTPEVTKRAAEIRATASPNARRISDADAIMVAQAQMEGAILVTSDRALQSIPGLTAKDWNAL